MTDQQTRTEDDLSPVARLNDLARSGQLANARFVFTHALIATLAPAAPDALTEMLARAKLQRRLIAAIADAAFNPDNDPHGEHDFGIFVFENRKIYWKIDVYENDGTFQWGANDPGDPATSYRIVTFMLPEDY